MPRTQNCTHYGVDQQVVPQVSQVKFKRLSFVQHIVQPAGPNPEKCDHDPGKNTKAHIGFNTNKHDIQPTIKEANAATNTAQKLIWDIISLNFVR